MIIIPTREDLIVRLSVIRTEHQSHEGEVQLVAQGKMLLPDVETVGGDGGRHEVQGDPGLGGIIGIAHIVEKS